MSLSAARHYGQCLCGAVRFSFSGEPLTCYACHCSDCQRRTGSAFALSLLLRRDQVQLEAGQPESYLAHLPDGRSKHGQMCKACGTRLWGEPLKNPHIAVIQPGVLDQPQAFAPVAHQWIRSKQPWVVIPPGVACFETQPASAAELIALWKARTLPAVPEVTGIDHSYITVSDLARAEPFYDLVLRDTLGFVKAGRFQLGPDTHLNYYNRLFGFVLRPARVQRAHEPYAPGLHHFCLRVDTAEDVREVALRLRSAGIAASPARLYPEYAPDYWATFFEDPDGVRLEVTNFRGERRERHDHWSQHRKGRSA